MNPFKDNIAAGKVQVGLWQALANPYTAEICAVAGFDWLLIDGEHAPNDIPLMLTQLQAVAPYPVEPVVRAPVGDPVIIKQLLDIGARTLMIPMVESAEQASALVAATRYPPLGFRGVGAALARGSRWNRRTNYLHDASDEICLLLQVENRAGLDALDAIARVDGVSGVFLGPSDLAAWLGHIGKPTHPEVTAALRDGIARIRSAGLPAGILANVDTADDALAWGATFVAVGTDVTILARGAEALAARFAGAAERTVGADNLY